MDALVIYYVAKTVHFLWVEIEFALLKVKLCFAQLVKYEFEMLLVLFDRIAKNKYIIKIYVYESSDEISEDYHHKTLECSGSIAISLLHRMAHEGAIDGSECGFPHVARFHVYLFICVGQIDLWSIFRSSNIMSDLLLVGEGHYVLLHIVVLLSTINDSVKFRTVLFIHAQHGCGLGDICLFPPSSFLIKLDFID
jgi:hypothetical protein